MHLLKSKYKFIWEELGKPSGFFWTPANSAFIKWLFNKKYNKLQDFKLNRLGNILRYVYLYNIVVGSILLLISIVFTRG